MKIIPGVLIGQHSFGLYSLDGEQEINIELFKWCWKIVWGETEKRDWGHSEFVYRLRDRVKDEN